MTLPDVLPMTDVALLLSLTAGLCALFGGLIVWAVIR